MNGTGFMKLGSTISPKTRRKSAFSPRASSSSIAWTSS